MQPIANLPPCDCTSRCGDDPWLHEGRAAPCENYKQWLLCRDDPERFAWLEALRGRRREPSEAVPGVSLKTDIHIAADGVAIYLRDSRGKTIQQGHGATLREAIDNAMKDQA